METAREILEETTVTDGGLHRPVLLRETVRLLAPRQGGVVVDGTLGAGGHAEALLEVLGPDGRVLGIDRDPVALAAATRRLARFGDRFVPIRGNHLDVQKLLEAQGVFVIDGAVFDLGLSSMQLDDPARGFAFRHDGPLDMRMDPAAETTAADLLARLSREELRDLLWRFGEERQASGIAREIVRARARQPLTRTSELAELCARVAGPAARRFKLHPATRTFQALRIAVNTELAGLDRMIAAVVSILRRGARVAVISYHSLEDRAIKTAFRDLARRCTCPPRLPACVCGRENLVRVVTGKPVRPGADEIQLNPRARSAKLRVAERL